MDDSIKADIIWISLFLLILANVYVWQVVFSLSGNLKVVFFDVGQGDSIFIETSQGHQILIDGGPGERILDKLAKQMPFWDKTLDLVVSTHSHFDHLSGLLKVLERYEIENVIWNGVEDTSSLLKSWKNGLSQEKARVLIAKQGQRIKAGKTELYVLHPFESLAGKEWAGDLNDSSVVIRLEFGRNSFLFTGDITKKVENELVERANSCVSHSCVLASDVLKVPHHGSKTSATKEFLAEVSPHTAVISVGGQNSYGNPHQDVLSNLAEFGINVLRTDINGDVVIK